MSRPVALATATVVGIVLLGLPAPTSATTFTAATGRVGLGGIQAWGAAWADYDEDGWPDLFVSGTENRLFHNVGGLFEEVSGPWRAVADGTGVAWADYDGDGDLDLFVASRTGANGLLANRGNGRFDDVAADAGVSAPAGAAGVAWADFDGDGDLDLFVAGRFAEDTTDRLYRNDGDGTFTEVGAQAKVAGSSERKTFGGAWFDYDGDDDLDLYLAVDFGDDVLYRNKGNGTFARVGGISGSPHGMGIAVGDPNGDGWLDLACTNNTQDEAADHGPTTWYENQGDGSFLPIEGEILDRSVVEWGIDWVDFDNDGDEDLAIVAGGMLTDGEPNVLYVNDGRGRLEDATRATGVEDGGAAFGSAWADFDRDGDLDWFVANERGGESVLFENQGPVGHHLRVRLGGSNRGIGATVRADVRTTVDRLDLVRLVQAGESYLSAGELEAFFGLGEALVADEIVVRWPSGAESRLYDVVAGQDLTVLEGGLHHAAAPVAVELQKGSASGDLADLDRRDELSLELVPNDKGVLKATFTLELPAGAQAQDLVDLRVRAVVRGAARPEQKWTWRLRDVESGRWRRIGDNRELADGVWSPVVLRPDEDLSGFVDPDGRIGVRLQSRRSERAIELDLFGVGLAFAP